MKTKRAFFARCLAATNQASRRFAMRQRVRKIVEGGVRGRWIFHR